MAPKRKRTLAGPFPFLATAGLPLAALIFRLERPVRVPSVIIPIAMRWVIIVKLAILVMLVIRVARWLRRHNAVWGARRRAATDDAGASHRHGDVRQGPTGQDCIGHGDGPGGATREDVSFDRRSRKGHAGAGRPVHVARLPATGHDHREAGAAEGCPDLENPDRVGVATRVEG